ncbi:MAG: hypothetical protein RQ863_07210 [Sulfolobales archaeon]|nr:hypothetical protein [Sulfolobales archaeon]
MKVKAIVQLPDGRQVEVVAEPETLSYIGFGGPENPTALEDLQIISTEIVEA